VSLPSIEFQRGLHPRGRPVEAGGDVLLSIGDEIGLGVLRIDRDMHAKAKPRRFRDIFHDLHLSAIIADAVDVEAGRRFRDVGRNAVDETVLAALRAIDELEPIVGVGARKRAEMMRDRVVVAIVPVPNRCEHPVGVEVERVATAAEFRRQKGDPFAEAAAADIGFGIDEFAADRVTLRFRDHCVAGALRAAGCSSTKCAEGNALRGVESLTPCRFQIQPQ
jgi:hypothetical protein